MSFIIEKFGGTSLGDCDRMMRAAAIAAADSLGGDHVVVVVSAQGHSTDRLIQNAMELGGGGRELDMLMATGEQASAALMAMALQGMGVEAVSLCGWQAGINTDGVHGQAVIRYIDAQRILRELERGRVVVVAGFQGISPDGDITTIGRGGSDTTAVALAGALGADICRIYTDVKGVFSSDPSIVPQAFAHRHLCYDDMLELTRAGARVLHDKSVEMAKRYNVTIEVLDSAHPKEGTMINGKMTDRRAVVGAALGEPMLVARIKDGGDQERRRKLFKGLARRRVNVDTISWGEELCFTTAAERRAPVEKEIRRVYPSGWDIIEGARRLSVVGSGVSGADTAEMLDCLEEAGVGVRAMACGNISLSAIVDEDKAELGLRTVHRRFLEG